MFYGDLILSFSPDAIREHFEDDPDYGNAVDDMTDLELAGVGEWALNSPVLYKIFHELLAAGMDEALAKEEDSRIIRKFDGE